MCWNCRIWRNFLCSSKTKSYRLLSFTLEGLYKDENFELVCNVNLNEATEMHIYDL